ncbi:MAG: ABC transporter permease [Candidatus Woesearchaeota archaeon]
MKRIFYLMQKNILLLLRNWISFFLLILGPFLIMIIVGLVFSQTTHAGITIGIVTTNDQVADFFEENVGQAFTTMRFTDNDDCLQLLYKEQTHACIKTSDTFRVGDSPTGLLEIYYDNSRVSLSPFLINYFQERLGIISDKVTKDSATMLLTQIEELSGFMGEGKQTLTGFSLQVINLQEQTNQFLTDLQNSQDQFETFYDQLTVLNNRISVTDLEDVPDQLDSIRITLDDSLQTVRLAQSRLEETDSHMYSRLQTIDYNIALLEQNLSDDSESLELLEVIKEARNSILLDDFENAKQTVDQAEQQLTAIQSTLDRYEGDIVYVTDSQRIEEFNRLYTQATDFRQFLNTSVSYLTQTQGVLGQSQEQLQLLLEALELQEEDLKQIAQLNVEEFVTPLSTSNIPLLPSASEVYLLFPQYLPIIVIFISILFANIILLGEIYSTAQLRNFVLPVYDWMPLLAYFFTNLLVIGFQISVLLTVAHFAFGVSVLDHLFTVIIALFLLSSICILIGMICAYLTNSKENSILLTTFIAVGLFLSSNLMVPVAMMTPIVAFFVSLNPIVLADTILRRSLFFDIGVQDSLISIVFLVIYIFILTHVLYALVHSHRHSYN